MWCNKETFVTKKRKQFWSTSKTGAIQNRDLLNRNVFIVVKDAFLPNNPELRVKLGHNQLIIKRKSVKRQGRVLHYKQNFWFFEK